MSRNTPRRPTRSEIEILTVLWRQDGQSIRAVSEQLRRARRTATYATTQTLMRIMEGKGLVRRGLERYPAKYFVTAQPDAMRAMLVRDLAERAFEQSLPRLIEIAARASATAAERTRPDEAQQWLAIASRAEALERRTAQHHHQQQYRRAG